MGAFAPQKEKGEALRRLSFLLARRVSPPGKHLAVYPKALRLFRHILPVESVLRNLHKPPLVGRVLQHCTGDGVPLPADLQPSGSLGADVRHVIAAAIRVIHPHRRAVLPVRLGGGSPGCPVKGR